MRFRTYQKCLPKFSIIDCNISEVHFSHCFQNKQPKHMCDFDQIFSDLPHILNHFSKFECLFVVKTDKEPVPFFVVTGKLSHS